MKNYKHYDRIVAIKEMSAGNAEVGDMWFETKTFHKNRPISDILKWASDCGGKLTITIDESTVEKDSLEF